MGTYELLRCDTNPQCDSTPLRRARAYESFAWRVCLCVVPVMLPLTLSSSTFLWLDPRMGDETVRFCQTSTVRTLSSWSRKEWWRCSACWLGGVSGMAGKGAADAALPCALSLCAGESASASARSDAASESVVALDTRGRADALEATLTLTPAGRGAPPVAAAAEACAGEAAEGSERTTAADCCSSPPSMWKRGRVMAGGLAIWLALLGESSDPAVLLVAGGV